MIAEKLLGHINKCIQLYDEKCGRDYVIVFGKGKKSAVNYCRITFMNTISGIYWVVN